MRHPFSQPIFGLEDKPSFVAGAFMGLHYLVKFALLIILPIAICRTTHASLPETLNFVSLSLLGGAVSTVLLAKQKPLGTQLFLPCMASISYFACLLHVAQGYDLAHVLGAAILIACFQFFCSGIYVFLRKLMTVRLAGLIFFSLGVWMAILGVSELFHPIALGQVLVHGFGQSRTFEAMPAVLGLLTLIIIILCLFVRKLAPYGILLGLLIGWMLGGVFHLAAMTNIRFFSEAPWFFVPHAFHAVNFSFSGLDYFIFACVAFYSSLILFTLVVVVDAENACLDQLGDAKKTGRANVISSLTSFIVSLLGGYPIEPIQGAVGDMLLTRSYTRYIAYFYAALIAVLAFLPKVLLLFTTVPAAVNGAAVLLMGGMICSKAIAMMQFDTMGKARRSAYAYAILALVLTEFSANIYQLNYVTYFTSSGTVVSYLVLLFLLAFYAVRRLYAKN